LRLLKENFTSHIRRFGRIAYQQLHYSNLKKENVMAKAKRKKAKSTAKKKKKSGLAQMTYSLSSELQAVVGAKHLSRPQIVKKLWVYIKAHKCQDTKNRRLIVPDEKLAKVFGGKKPVDMLKMSGLLNKHIKK
jgi:DNA topoisomerase-1